MAEDHPPSERRPSWLRKALSWGAWPLVAVPFTILVHEAAHWLTAVAVGYPDPALHYSSISHGDVDGYPAASAGLVGMAGPVVTALQILASIAWVLWRRAHPLAFALGVAAASRFAIAVPYTVANIAVLLTGRRLQPPEFDEHKAALALGLSGDVALAVTSLLVIAVLFWLARYLPKGERTAAWTGLLLGTAIGWIWWLVVLGPILLP